MPPSVKAQSPNHWAAREVPGFLFRLTATLPGRGGAERQLTEMVQGNTIDYGSHDQVEIFKFK